MRWLIVNPNSSAGVTARIDAAARAAALPAEVIRTVAAEGAPPLIVTPEDATLAEAGVVAAVRSHAGQADGVVIASFGDTGIARVRAAVALPVEGIAESAFRAALGYGPCFAIASFDASVEPSLRGIVEHYGLGAHLAGVEVLRGAVWSDPGAIGDELAADIGRMCRDISRRPEIDSIVLGGGPLAGLARRLQPSVRLPLIDGTEAAIARLRAQVMGASPHGAR